MNPWPIWPGWIIPNGNSVKGRWVDVLTLLVSVIDAIGSPVTLRLWRLLGFLFEEFVVELIQVF